jgi:UDP-N-acetylmuramoylalanine--D-glutamate ligase
VNQNSKITILGAAESGIGAALLAKAKGFNPFVSDSKEVAKKYRDILVKHQIEFEEKGHTVKIELADIIIKSPGIPSSIKLIQSLKDKGKEIISEVEFASRFVDNAKIIAITGSNGKTTTTSLVHHILKKSGLNAALCGNIGKSFAGAVAEGKWEFYVVEVSSFQLDDVNSFKPKIAILTNITPDHLDRYDYKLENYASSKLNITKFQDETDFFIYSADCEITAKALINSTVKASMHGFSLTKNNTTAFLQNEEFFINYNQIPFNMSIHDLAIQGRHNLANSMAAGVAARIMEIRKEQVRESLTDFQGIEHRLEFVASIHGIRFINDSKATNINSTWYALESINTPIVWIVGGVDKGNDYSELDALVKQKVKAIICLGLDNEKIINHFKGIVPVIVETDSARKAVTAAYEIGKKGDSVLLSPCCASFDLFESYEDRGDQFKRAVKSL